MKPAAKFRAGTPARASVSTAIWVTTMVIAGVAVLLALYTWETGSRLALAKSVPPSWLLNWIPGLFYLMAAWSLRRTLRALGCHEPLEASLAAPLKRTAIWLVLGSVSTVVPTAYFLSTAEGAKGTSIIFIVPAATILCVGIGFFMVAWVLDANAKLKADAAKLKSALEDFV